MADVKIVFLGAGSVRYTLQLFLDICKTKELWKSHVCLMDIDSEKLAAVHNLAERAMNEIGADLKIESTTSLERALEGADFIINTVLAKGEGHEDGYAQYEIMRQVGEKHGYYRGIDSQEFNMVSDYYTITNFNQLYTSLEIAKAVERICPNAYLIQTANPVMEITQIVLRSTKTKIIGFCHGFAHVKDVCEALGLEFEKVDWQVAGVNHGIWLNRFRYNGEDAYKLFDKWIEEKSSQWEPKSPWDVQLSPAVIDMYRFYGMIPIGDTARNGSWKYHYNLETKKKWYGKFGGIDNEIERPKFYEELRALRKKLLALARDKTVKLSQVFPEEFRLDRLSGEQQVPFINALVNNKPARLFLNVLNDSIIQELPKNVVVEVPCVVDAEGIHPEKIDPPLTPRIIKYFLVPRIMRMEMAVEAFLTGDKKVLEEFLIRDPRTKSYEQVKAVLDEIMNLPFNKRMKEHYEWE